MTEEAMRAAFVGKPLQGYYHNGITWAATFEKDRRYKYQEEVAGVAEGTWHFQGSVFCHYVGPPYSELGCGAAKKISANCYEFHLVRPHRGLFFSEKDFRPDENWHSRGWRRGEPSTCHDSATV